MSMQSAMLCRDRISSDAEFRGALQSLPSRDERHKVAAQAGYIFTGDEWKTLHDSSPETEESRFGIVKAGCTFPNECK